MIVKRLHAFGLLKIVINDKQKYKDPTIQLTFNEEDLGDAFYDEKCIKNLAHNKKLQKILDESEFKLDCEEEKSYDQLIKDEATIIRTSQM